MPAHVDVGRVGAEQDQVGIAHVDPADPVGRRNCWGWSGPRPGLAHVHRRHGRTGCLARR